MVSNRLTRPGVALAVTIGTIVPGTFALAATASGSSRPRPPRSTTTAAATNTTTQLPLGSMYRVVDQIGARALWQRGIDGSGVNVAVIDTGVAPVAALSPNVVALVDLSAEAGINEARFIDTFGHGTHMAGIIAGTTPGADPAQAAAHPEWFMGVAPRAGIVSVKVADNSGAVDITQVIAGVDWVTDHAAELNIKVLNLSYSSGSTLPAATDPLTQAVERAWLAGIVVVVAAGNDGRQERHLSSPAIDPWVLSVAAAEALTATQFTVPNWATSGDATRNPDVSAPGAHIDSLRAPLSRVDLEHPEGFVSETLFRGSGSSQAAAVVSGAAALLLDARPSLTPDQVKALLMASAQPGKILPTLVQFSGAGLIRVDVAVGLATPTSVQSWPLSDGSAPLSAARLDGDTNIFGQPIVGETTVLGTPWEGTRWTGTRWTGGTWDGTRWTDGEWMGTRWTGGSWTGTRWTGTTWTGTTWTGTRWTGTTWTGTTWTGTRWTDASWTGTRWTGTRWTDASWTGTRWTGGGWS
jgi:serine protease AprX